MFASRVILALLLACDAPAAEIDVEGSSSGEVIEPEPEPEPEPDPCAVECAEGQAVCHACRCRVAFDDWLPDVEDVQCGAGTPIVVHRADLSGDDAILEPAPPGTRKCANPSLLTGSCRQGSRLGELRHDDVIMRWICRDPYRDRDGSVIYEDVALIGHNTRTGATCFWDDVDDVLHDDDMPALDLSTATEAERREHDATFQFESGEVCVQCHDHDPFVYTPYLASTGWTPVAVKGPYSMVGLDRTPRPTGVRHLVSPEAAPCTSCHRLGDQATCRRFAADAMGLQKDAFYEDDIRTAAEPGNPHWRLAYWMPGEPLASREAWDATFAAAREAILDCCEDPTACDWEPVPTRD